MKARAHVFVSGRVQGVFFRSETRSKARRQDVTGWIRNLPDGRVEAIFEGERENVDKLVQSCRMGPTGARVAGVEVAYENYRGEFEDFEIIY